MSKNVSHLSGREGKELTDSLWERLLEAARDLAPPEDLREIGDEFLVGEAMTWGTSSFYDLLKPEARGKRAFVCNGSACLLAGTQDAVQEELARHLPEESIGHLCCLGRCHENGAFQFEGRNYSARTPEEIAGIVGGEPETSPSLGTDPYHVGSSMSEPLLTAPFAGVESFYAEWERALARDPLELLAEIRTANLRGRGGAGFPMAFKLESCRDTPGDRKYIVCNADEGDPGAFSDRYLMEQRPHLVLFGMMVAGYIAGAQTGVIYIRAEYPESVEAMSRAVMELERRGLVGQDIRGSGFDFRFKVMQAAGAYICGEETALLNSIEGQRGEVRVRPPYPTQEGLFNRPTVVNNVETLACVHAILARGGAAFASLGRGRSTGTKLLSLDSAFRRPGLYEVELGTPLKTVVDELGHGFRKPVKALHIGGPLGGIVPISKIDDLTVDFESFAENGFLLGHASVLAIPEDFPMVLYLEHLFEFTEVESCGKCFPCRIGSVRGKELLRGARTEGRPIPRQLFDDLLETLEIGSLCALGGGLPLGVKNALHYFQDELEPHFVSD
ncbi:MAG: formate dehydrogenase [Gemmatimonadales bacterium]|nr:MAG: formate dehydrogenase [Gemmatimonadales bacterium]